MKIFSLFVLVLFFGCAQQPNTRTPASTGMNILMIGDSHTAGPFGQYVHQSVAAQAGVNIITYGHSSSAALHWLSERRHKLSGGVYHHLSAHRTINPYELIRMDNPHPTDWREAVEVPLYEPLVSDIALHEEWKSRGFPTEKADIVVIALGANDRGFIFNANGSLNQNAFDRHVTLNRELAQIATANGARCLWIGPPHGRTKTDEQQAALYRMLGEALEGTSCQLVSSNHYKAMGCDGVHFNCSSELPNARAWATEMSNYIKELINP